MPPKAHPRRQPSRRNINNEASDGPPEPLSPGRTSPGPSGTAELADVAENTPNPNSTVDRTPRPQVQRLASLNNPRRGSEQPINPSSPHVAAKRLKFQPKSAIRRSKEEREATERAEAERLQARLAASDSSSGILPETGGSRGRGDRRSGTASLRWQGERYAGSGAVGFLGGATPAEDKRQREALLTRSRGGAGGSRPSMLSGAAREATKHETSTAVKKESNARSGKAKDKDGDTTMRDTEKRRSTRVKKEKGESFVREESDDELFELGSPGKRINIENINLISDEDSSDEVFATSGQGIETERSRTPRLLGNSSMRPIRIDRHEHVERTIGVNTDASSLTSAELRRQAKARGEAHGSLFLPDSSDLNNGDAGKPKGRKKGRDVEFLRNERKWQGVYQDDEDDDMPVEIKEEPKEQNDPMIIDDHHHHHEMEIEGTAITQGMLDEQRQASIPKSNATPDHPPTTTEPSPPKPRHKRKTKRKGPRFLTCRKPIPQPSADDEDNKDVERHRRHNDDALPIPTKQLLSFTLQPPPLTLPPPIQRTKKEKKKKKEDTDADRNATAELQKTRLADRKAGAVYLFQLPPLLPAPQTSNPSEHPPKPKTSPAPDEEEEKKNNNKSDPQPQPQPQPQNPNITTTTPDPSSTPTHALPLPSSSSTTSQQGVLGHINIPDAGIGGEREMPMATWSNALRMDLGRATDYGALSEVVMFGGSGGVGGVGRGARANVGEEAWAVGGMGGGVCVVPDWGWLFGG